MAYNSRVYRILIASPSDVEEEREIAVRVIQEWNDLYSYTRKVALLPLRWETHTAPDYGTRPQEVINRAIVDDCDLLVGIFWTRLGSPTGASDSGTLEEIERVGKAGKPIMLYFSRVEIDPDRIDVEQIERLKVFKEKTYPKGLVEHYRKIIEFRDKFAKQLELKIRDIQRSDESGQIPLSLNFLSIKDGKPAGSMLTRSYEIPDVEDYGSVPATARDKVKEFVVSATKQRLCTPIPLVIANSSSSGLRNLYVELDCRSTSEKLELTDTGFSSSRWRDVFFYNLALTNYDDPEIDVEDVSDLRETLAKFQEGKLQKVEHGWRVSFEWEALQPQRVRLIKPLLYLFSPESSQVDINARVFADTFPEPLLLHATVQLDVKQRIAGVNEVLPNWQKLLDREMKKAVSASGLLKSVSD
jgi:hypothetical protein